MQISYAEYQAQVVGAALVREIMIGDGGSGPQAFVRLEAIYHASGLVRHEG
jgi:hypothetical protein